MTKVIALDEAELSEIVEELQPDDEVVITRDGKPVARVVPIAVPRRPLTLDELRQAVLFIGDVETPSMNGMLKGDRRRYTRIALVAEQERATLREGARDHGRQSDSCGADHVL